MRVNVFFDGGARHSVSAQDAGSCCERAMTLKELLQTHKRFDIVDVLSVVAEELYENIQVNYR